LDALAGLALAWFTSTLWRFPSLPSPRNIVLGRERIKALEFWISKAPSKRFCESQAEFSADIDPDALVEDLPVGLQQRVEIIRALIYDAKVLILDEPTAVLTPQETDESLKNMKKLRETKARSIVYYP
jgi:simple sugar transport system ATP-binding protein